MAALTPPTSAELAKGEPVDFSVVMPAYDEEANIPPLLERVHRVLGGLGRSYEVVVVDNGSRDATPRLLAEWRARLPGLVVVTLTRNFGYDGAISAGLEHARGRWVVIMDGDQQDPPEEIPRFLQAAASGYDIVYGIRAKRTEGPFIGFLMKAYYRIWTRIAAIDVPRDAGNFGIMSQRAVRIVNDLPERSKFVRGLRAWTGLPATGLVYQRDERTLGETKFNLLKYINHAINGITSFSTVPIRLFTLGGMGAMALTLLLTAFFVVTKLAELLGQPLLPYPIDAGFSTLALLLTFLISLTALGLGIIGEYVGRILEEVKHRPNFLVAKVERGPDAATTADAPKLGDG